MSFRLTESDFDTLANPDWQYRSEDITAIVEVDKSAPAFSCHPKWTTPSITSKSTRA